MDYKSLFIGLLMYREKLRDAIIMVYYILYLLLLRRAEKDIATQFPYAARSYAPCGLTLRININLEEELLSYIFCQYSKDKMINGSTISRKTDTI